MSGKTTARVLYVNTDSRGLTPAESVKALDDIRERSGEPVAVRSMPKPEFVSQRQLDREKAMRMIEGEMLASLARCAELERDL